MRRAERLVARLGSSALALAVAVAVAAGEMDATVLQPAVRLARTAVEQAPACPKDGKTSLPEKQALDRELVTRENAAQFGLFARK